MSFAGISEEEFLDLWKFTGPSVYIDEFYRQVLKIDKRLEKERFEAFKRGTKKQTLDIKNKK